MLQAPEDEVYELAKLRQLVDSLRQSVRARDDFIAIAAHELRNPMTPIVGVAELALIAGRKDGRCPPRVIILLERLQRLVQDYVRRTSKLLDVSRLEDALSRLSGGLRARQTGSGEYPRMRGVG